MIHICCLRFIYSADDSEWPSSANHLLYFVNETGLTESFATSTIIADALKSGKKVALPKVYNQDLAKEEIDTLVNLLKDKNKILNEML